MKTFFNILQTLSDIPNKIYPDRNFVISDNFDNSIYLGEKGHIITLMNTIFYKIKECKKATLFSKNAFSKFASLNSILENPFFKRELKEHIFNIFQRAQKHYYAFTRIVHIYRLKKNKHIVTNDLMMNTIDPNHKLTFTLLENKSIFLFNINEIVNIIETAIGNSDDFFCNPLSPLNPYNNQELTHATLYNIYFQIKNINRVTPLLFHYFFLENFDKDAFVKQYEPNIREYAIKKYVFNSPHTILYSSVISMLRNNEYTRKLSIDEDFPKDLLVDIFRPFLFHDYIDNFYIKDTSKVYNSRQLLYVKLKNFYKFNPCFGRKILKFVKKNTKIIKKEYILNTKHISFNDIPFSNNDNITMTQQSYSINSVVYFLNNTHVDENSNIDEDDEDNNIENDSNENDNDTQIEEDQNSYFWQNDETNSTSEDDYYNENDSIS